MIISLQPISLISLAWCGRLFESRDHLIRGGAVNIHISDWLPWTSRGLLPPDPGVYVIAKGRPDEVIYVGKTWGGNGLRGRIVDFHRSATTGLKGHAGGVTYYERFGIEVDDLFVAAHVPVTIRRDPEILYAYVHFVERRLIWEYVERVGRLPACNSE